LPALAGMLKRRVDELEPFEPEALELRLQVSKLHSLVAKAHLEQAEASSAALKAEQNALLILKQSNEDELQRRKEKIELLEHEVRREAARAMAMEQARVKAAQQASITTRHLDRLQAELARVQALSGRLEAESSRIQAELASNKERLSAAEEQTSHLLVEKALILSSTSWRVASPLRWIGRLMPQGLRRLLRGSAKIVFWTVTFQLRSKLRARNRVLQEVRRIRIDSDSVSVGVKASEAEASLDTTPVAAIPPARQIGSEEQLSTAAPAPIIGELASGATPVADELGRRFESLDHLRTYPEPRSVRRVSIVTDGISPGLLYGGVATAVLLGALIAQRTKADLRIITRFTEADPATVGAQLAAMGVSWKQDIDCLLSPPREGADIPVFRGDLFLTTSWWTTQATLRAVNAERIVYLLQEDERMFYPRGDDRLRCSETLGNPEVAFVVNSSLLFKHFESGDEPLQNVARHGVSFEPAFPLTHYYDDVESRHSRSKKNFLFYGRPNNVRNLYWRGLEAINAALEDGTIKKDDWNITFVGRDLHAVVLSDGVQPKIVENLSWSSYAALIRDSDVGLMLIDTPHPSYPPLDIAASGGVAVTNRCGIKTSLAAYSNNIICVEATVEALKDGIAQAVSLAANEEWRQTNYLANRLCRDWNEALEPAICHAVQRMPKE
jgi:hypothetical protein